MGHYTVFHVSNLNSFHEDPTIPERNQLTRGGVIIQPRSKCQPEEILAKRTVTIDRKKHKEYLVKWKGLADDEISWEREEDLKKLT